MHKIRRLLLKKFLKILFAGWENKYVEDRYQRIHYKNEILAFIKILWAAANLVSGAAVCFLSMIDKQEMELHSGLNKQKKKILTGWWAIELDHKFIETTHDGDFMLTLNTVNTVKVANHSDDT